MSKVINGLRLLTIVICLNVFYGCSSNENQPPNIVIIFTDDQGYADLGCYGAEGFETPNIDGLASEGKRFTNFYVSQAVCSASRASLLTGCYAERIGIQGALSSHSRMGINPEEELISELLKKQGYATGIFGKWHLGDKKEFLPLQHGFDEYYGLPYSNDMWPVDYNGLPITVDNPGSNPWKSNHPPLPLIEGNEKIKTILSLEDQAQLTTSYTKKAVDFIKRNVSNPFFLYLPHSMPHVPLAVSDKFKGKSDQGLYGDVILEIDWSVGEILKTLKEYNLEENTVVFFASDNGPWLNMGKHGGSAYPLREGKGTMWEGGARVPFIIRWPGNIKPGSVSDNLIASIDILPTICEITGAQLPQKRIDGINQLPLLMGDPETDLRQSYNFYYGNELRAVREGNWKLYFPHRSISYKGVEPGKNGYPGPLARLDVGLELYDLEKDISETNNVASEFPLVVNQLRRIAEEVRLDLGDRLNGITGNGIREPGKYIAPPRKSVDHLAIGKTLKLKNKFHAKYKGTGDNSLIDGNFGDEFYSHSSWQGFEGVDLIADIDLGESRIIKTISLSLLENQVSWIFFPTKVTFLISADGKNFEEVYSENYVEYKINAVATLKEIELQIEKERCVQFIRVIANNRGICPPGHPGEGGPCWIFADEIVIK